MCPERGSFIFIVLGLTDVFALQQSSYSLMASAFLARVTPACLLDWRLLLLLGNGPFAHIALWLSSAGSLLGFGLCFADVFLLGLAGFCIALVVIVYLWTWTFVPCHQPGWLRARSSIPFPWSSKPCRAGPSCLDTTRVSHPTKNC